MVKYVTPSSSAHSQLVNESFDSYPHRVDEFVQPQNEVETRIREIIMFCQVDSTIIQQDEDEYTYGNEELEE